MEHQPKEEQEILKSRVKRDEWSEGGIECLLEAYECKWVVRNRAKLKGLDWEEVARQVSSRGSVKTATQCKNKIESMKKRYRNEVAAGTGSRWPLFAKLDGLVRCGGGPAAALVVLDDHRPAPVQAATAGAQKLQSPELNGVSEAPPPPPPPSPQPQEDNKEVEEQVQHTELDRVELDQHAPSCSSPKENHETMRKKRRKRRNEEEGWEVMESFQLLAEVVLRVEQSRMESMREVEKIRAEAEARRSEMELKRTEIIAETQLQIAKLFTRRRRSDNVDSSPRTSRD